ncbi:MAG TPA: RagB/SusD family nutrient uptake outer membrane protein [Prolixibacteraceae bacterium]|nr:RagB/SusD family nutrient uptake outer membrane protein [Prolixibacteraceae bacterium]
MKKSSYIALIVLLSAFMACEDVLDKQNLNSVSDRIWDDEVTASLYLNKLYQDNMPPMSLGESSAWGDETYSSSEGVSMLLYGLVEPTNFSTSFVSRGTDVFHKDNYKLIRQINIALEGIEGSILNDSIKGILIGQARFLRAYRYWEIVKIYGGVPMILHVQDPYTEVLDKSRNKTSDCIDRIVEDLDYGIENLPDQWLESDFGRITRGAAAAYKGRVLLHWASPMFNPENKSERWQQAYDANKQALDLLARTNRGLHPDYGTIFTTNVLTNVEAILFRQFSAAAGQDFASEWESDIRPRSGGGSGGQNPTWNLVKAFGMANGKRITDPGSGYDSTYFWQNRDPRFYHIIAYNGCTWEMSGKSSTVQWAYDRNIQENNTKPGTGFYCKKASDANLHKDNTSLGSHTWHEIRYAEVLLNFAECANEVEKKDEAISKLIDIRKRAGIEAGDGNYGIPSNPDKTELLEIIMNERQIELAFENKRYWDLRRRKMFTEDLGPNTRRLNGTYRYGLLTQINARFMRPISVPEDDPFYGWKGVDTAAYYGSININDSESYNTYFKTSLRIMEAVVNNVPLSLNYQPLYDFMSVPDAMLNSTDSIAQTIGWFNGSFDPLDE